MSEYCSLHVNIPSDLLDRMRNIVDAGKYLNVSDATRHYLRDGIEKDEEK